MVDVVLIMPSANRFDKVSVRVPNGLLAIAARPVASGLTVKIIDFKTDPDWEQTLRASVGEKTVCVGITCCTGRMISSALKAAQVVREKYPLMPLVWGGPHPTLVPEQTLKHPLVDMVVINEGDEAFGELVEALRSGKSLDEVQGIGFKRDGKAVFTGPRELCRDIDAMPILPYQLLDMSRYSALSLNGEKSIDLVTSRGCPHACSFCSTPVLSERRWRAMSVPRLLEHIRFLYDVHGVRTFYFSDDNFMVDLRRVNEFCDALACSGMTIHWGTQGVTVATLRQMDDVLLDKIEASGCVEISIGIESANPEILASMPKRGTTDEVLAVNRRLSSRRKIAVKYNMIIGFPGETSEQVQRTVDLAIRLQEQNPRAWFPFNIFTPFPGTPEFDKAVSLGFKAPARLEDWARLESVGWGKHFNYWYGPRETAWLESINFTSYLAFPSAAKRISNPLTRMLFQLYQPIANFRFRNNFYWCHWEKALFR